MNCFGGFCCILRVDSKILLLNFVAQNFLIDFYGCVAFQELTVKFHCSILLLKFYELGFTISLHLRDEAQIPLLNVIAQISFTISLHFTSGSGLV